MAKKQKSDQVQIKFGEPEAFALVIEQTTDGDRVAQETAQSEADKQYAETQQTSFA